MLAACGGDDDAAEPDARPADPAPDLDDAAAWLRVSLATYDGGGSTYLTGNLITDPPLWPYDVEPVDGACRFATRQTGDCVPFCEWNQACVGGVCVSPPLVRDAGAITFDGGSAPVTVPFEDGFYQWFDQALRFSPGATVTASAPGAAPFAAFSLAAVAPAPLALVGIDELRLRAGTPMTIRWQPADPGSRVRVTMGADLGHAFFRSVVVECDAPDEHGAITVPQHMVDRLADPQNWSCGDCFSQEVRRYRRARTTAGSVPLDLWVNQTASFYLYPER
ncbi:MAG: hypothetical protein K8M05_24105 [Deltaproteobacteria bacterium]|nr:hypothetical protein [Kofleriaceae bacterium]